MSDLEQTAAPILRPMINDEVANLTPAQQLIIAQWMIKGAMVLDSMSSESTFYEQSERFHFRETLLPSGYLALFLGHYSGSYWRGGFTDHRLLTNGQLVPQYRSYVLTMAFGHLVLQLCETKVAATTNSVTLNLPPKKGEWSVVEFGPHLPNSIQWPPLGPSFDDSERRLIPFSKRFGGT